MAKVSKKTAAAKRAMKPTEDRFRAEFTCCGLCGSDGSRFFSVGPRLHLHHLVGGSRKSGPGHRRENWLILCARCHWHAHNDNVMEDFKRLPKIQPGHLLWCKKRLDHDWYDLRVLITLLRNPSGGFPPEWEPSEPDSFYLRGA